MSKLKNSLRIGERFESISYQGHKIEIGRNQFGYILIINGVDVSCGHPSVAAAEVAAWERLFSSRKELS